MNLLQFLLIQELEIHCHTVILCQLSSDNRRLLTGIRIHLLHCSIEGIICGDLLAILYYILLDPQIPLQIEAIRQIRIYIIYHHCLILVGIGKIQSRAICTVDSNKAAYLLAILILKSISHRSGVSLCIRLADIIGALRQVCEIHSTAALSLDVDCLCLTIGNRSRLILEKSYIKSSIRCTDRLFVQILIQCAQLLGHCQPAFFHLTVCLWKSLHIIFQSLAVCAIRHRKKHGGNCTDLCPAGLHQKVYSLWQILEAHLAIGICGCCIGNHPRRSHSLG